MFDSGQGRSGEDSALVSEAFEEREVVFCRSCGAGLRDSRVDRAFGFKWGTLPATGHREEGNQNNGF